MLRAGAVEENGDGLESTGTDADFRRTADVEEFDQTYVVDKSDVPVAVGDGVTIPRPWQGIPRVAMVFNFNYVYDDTAEEWVRQHPFSGGLFSVVVSEVNTIADNGFITISTGITDADLGGDILLPTCGLETSAPGVFVGFAFDQTSASELNYNIRWNPNTPEYEATVQNLSGTSLDVRTTVYRGSPS